MLTISVEFLHGTYRADPDGSAVGGRAEMGEWPPAVARLLAAFVAADAMGEACRVTDGSELEFLEGLGPPVIHAEASPWHQPLRERFVVLAAKSAAVAKTHQEYPARTAHWCARAYASHSGSRVWSTSGRTLIQGPR